MGDYWCANCNDTTVGWYKPKSKYICCARCKEPCEDIVVVIHALQAEIGQLIIANTDLRITFDKAQRLREQMAGDEIESALKQENTVSVDREDAQRLIECFSARRDADAEARVRVKDLLEKDK